MTVTMIQDAIFHVFSLRLAAFKLRWTTQTSSGSSGTLWREFWWWTSCVGLVARQHGSPCPLVCLMAALRILTSPRLLGAFITKISYFALMFEFFLPLCMQNTQNQKHWRWFSEPLYASNLNGIRASTAATHVFSGGRHTNLALLVVCPGWKWLVLELGRMKVSFFLANWKHCVELEQKVGATSNHHSHNLFIHSQINCCVFV